MRQRLFPRVWLLTILEFTSRPYHSYLSASIGSRLDALFAGYHPKKTPITVHTAKERTSELGNTRIGHDIVVPIAFEATIPIRIPISPPVMLISIDSARN